MNMQSLETGPGPEQPRPRALSVLAAAARLALGAAKRALPLPSGPDAVYNNGRKEGPPDLDELWRDVNRKLSGLFSNRGGDGGGSGGGMSPDANGAGIGIGLIGGWGALKWLGSGFCSVQEGRQAERRT